jgi:threonine dehydrogenase-like Zn-dependent dehydrogenase
VLGCGTIGYLLIQVLRLLQPRCEITAVAQFSWQAELAHAFGAERVLLVGQYGYSDLAQITGASLYQGRAGNQMLLGGFDLVYDVVGIQVTLNNALRWTRAGGTVVLVGVNLHRMKLDVTPVWYQEVDLIGAVGHDVVTWEGEKISNFELAMRWMETGQIRCEELLTHRYPLDAYRQAFATAVDKHQYRSIKVAFDLAGDTATG